METDGRAAERDGSMIESGSERTIVVIPAYNEQEALPRRTWSARRHGR